MKIPSFQFYPADWRKDIGVQSLSYHDRGVWLEILCLMHESEQRGKLLLNGKPMPEDVLARILGLDKQRLKQTLDNLLSSGVASIDDETKALTNRRMVKDEHIRQVRKEAGQKGGNPNLLNQKSNQNPTKPPNKNKPLHSSSSISSSSSDEEKDSLRESKKREIYLPDDFVLTDEMREWAELNTPSISPQHEFEKFCDYFRGKDAKKADWQAALRNWLRNAVDFQKNNNGANGNGNGHGKSPPVSKQETTRNAFAQEFEEIKQKKDLLNAG